MLLSAHAYAYGCFKTGQDQFHRNVRLIINMCLPGLTFDEQMRHVWITDSVLCSARVEGGRVPASAVRACGNNYLAAQLAALPNAVVVALGTKAAERLRRLDRHVLVASAAAPPEGNKPRARESWRAAAEHVRTVIG